MIEVETIDLSRMAYAEALALQRERLAAVQAGGRSCLFLVEHVPPVITLGRRGKEEADLVASPAQLQAMGVEVVHVTRGGQATYHGPGQLVGYPILNLGELGLAVPEYVRRLEETILRTLARFGIAGARIQGKPGVWVRGEGQTPWHGHLAHASQGHPGHPPGGPAGGTPAGPKGETPSPRAAPSRVATIDRKIAAVGVAVSRRVCYHGFALNVCTNLDHFGLIVPCGQPPGSVTSMSQLLGGQVELDEVKPALLECFGEVFGVNLRARTGKEQG